MHGTRKREEEARCRLIESDLLYYITRKEKMAKYIETQDRDDRADVIVEQSTRCSHKHPAYEQLEFDDEGYWNLSD